MFDVVTKDECRDLLAVNVKRLRLDRGVTQQALADAVGVARITINRIEQGHHAPEWDVICRLADALEVSVEEFRAVARAEKFAATA